MPEVAPSDLSGEDAHTSRLVLESLVEKHAARLFPLLQTELLGFIDRPKALPDLEAQYRRWSARQSPDGTQVWLNWAARDRLTGDYVGWFQATVFEDETIGLAYVIFPAYWRRGFATEAVCWMVDRLRKNYAPRLFLVEMDRENISSIAVAEKLGFTRCEKGPSPAEYRYEFHPDRAKPARVDH